MIETAKLPVAIIGAGPVGLAAAAHLASRGISPLLLERGASVGSTVLEWGHVHIFSPWRHNIDPAARKLLERDGWQAPDAEALPTGAELVRDYLAPLAAVPEISAGLRLRTDVTGITRQGRDKLYNDGREGAPFLIRIFDAAGERNLLARAVIDASGFWTQPNPMGADGLPVLGEQAAADRMAYGIPDVAGAEKPIYSGRRVLVVGAGHSAVNVALALMELQDSEPETRIYWALRRDRIERLIGGELNDELPERGALGRAARRAIASGRLTMLAPFSAERITRNGDVLTVAATLGGKPFSLDVDRIVVATGFRPDLSFLRELRINLDTAVEAPPALAPLIDPNFHSCGTVPPHGIAELMQPEPGFVIAGSKSYGRAPTFLMATGYEQVRSIVAHIAGDSVAAREVHLVLPKTGVCHADSITGPAPSAGCCGEPAPVAVDACCVEDAEAKVEGKADCGCPGGSADKAATVAAE